MKSALQKQWHTLTCITLDLQPNGMNAQLLTSRLNSTSSLTDKGITIAIQLILTLTLRGLDHEGIGHREGHSGSMETWEREHKTWTDTSSHEPTF